MLLETICIDTILVLFFVFLSAIGAFLVVWLDGLYERGTDAKEAERKKRSGNP
jgi:hypothetical protein